MGCSLSSPALASNDAPAAVTYAFPTIGPQASAYFGIPFYIGDSPQEMCSNILQEFFVGSSVDDGLQYPIIFWEDASNPTATNNATCSPISVYNLPSDSPLPSLQCNVPVSSLTFGTATISFSTTTSTQVAINDFSFALTTPFAAVATTTESVDATTGTSTSTSTTYIATTTVAPSTCGGARLRFHKRACSSNNLLRALNGHPADAASFCSTYTLSSATVGQAYPTFLSAYTASTSSVSSACSCFASIAATATTTSTTSSTTSSPTSTITAAPCNSDNLLRALRGNEPNAYSFCNTFTLSSATPGQAYPSYLAPYVYSASRISSGCSCIAPTYIGPAFTYISTSTSYTETTTATVEVNTVESDTLTVTGACSTV